MQNIKITPNEMKSALMRSGYLLENRIAGLLEKKGLLVLTNIVFKDPETAKSRELDIFADKMNRFHETIGCVIDIIYFIEVINNSQPLSFIVTKEPSIYTHDKLNFIIDIPRTDEKYQYITAGLTTEYHSINSRDVSLQYCSFMIKKSSNNKNIEWMAYHPDDLYETFKKLLFNVDIYSNEHSYISNDKRFSVCQYLQPVLVIKEDLYKIIVNKNTTKFVKANMVHYCFDYIYNGKQSSAIIDIVTEKYVPKYIDIMNKNIAHIKSYTDAVIT